MELKDIMLLAWRTAEDHGFHNKGRTFGDTCALIHTEISEAYEAFRHDGRINTYTKVDGKPEGAPVELLDAVIRIFDTLLEECKLDPDKVEKLLEQKMEYNKRRPYMHGKVI